MSSVKSSYFYFNGSQVPCSLHLKTLVEKQGMELRKRSILVSTEDLSNSLAAAYGFSDWEDLRTAELSAIVNRKIAVDGQDGTYYLVLAEGMFGSLDANNGNYAVDCAQAFKTLYDCAPRDINLRSLLHRDRGLDWIGEDNFESLPYSISSNGAPVIVTGVFCDAPDIEKHGLPHYGEPSTVQARIRANFTFQVCSDLAPTVFPNKSEGSGYTVFEVFVPRASDSFLHARA